jgi:hypothetical protein
MARIQLPVKEYVAALGRDSLKTRVILRDLLYSSRSTAAIMTTLISGALTVCGANCIQKGYKCYLSWLTQILLQCPKQIKAWMISIKKMQREFQYMSQYSWCVYSRHIGSQLGRPLHCVSSTSNNALYCCDRYQGCEVSYPILP